MIHKKFNLRALGGGMLTAGPLLVQFIDIKPAWWVGVVFTALGPIFLAFRDPGTSVD